MSYTTGSLSKLPEYYDPAAQLAMELAALLKAESDCFKAPAVYFDGHDFIINKAAAANARIRDVGSVALRLGFSSIDNPAYEDYHFCITNEWVGNAVKAFPPFASERLSIAENALAARMQAHIAFGFCGPWTAQSYDAALLLFKIIYTKSARIRERTGAAFLSAIEQHLRNGYLPAELSAAIRHAVHMLNIYHRGFL